MLHYRIQEIILRCCGVQEIALSQFIHIQTFQTHIGLLRQMLMGVL